MKLDFVSEIYFRVIFLSDLCVIGSLSFYEYCSFTVYFSIFSQLCSLIIMKQRVTDGNQLYIILLLLLIK